MKSTDNFKGKRNFKYRSYSIIMLIGLIVSLLLFNYFVTSLEQRFGLALDMTTNRIYSLSSVTKEIIRDMEEDIFIYTTEVAGIEDANVQEILKNYASETGKIHIKNIDVIKNPVAVEKYNEISGYSVEAGDIVVSNSADTNDNSQKYRILNYEDLYTFNEQTEQYDEFSAEEAITGAIKYIINPNNQRIWLLENHSSDGSANAILKELFENENYQVGMLKILNGQNPLDSRDVVIAISLESDLTSVERNILNDFLDSGGRMMIGIDPAINETINLSNALSIIERYNIEVGSGVIMETNLNNVAATRDVDYLYSFIIPEIKQHEITNDFLEGDYKIVLGSNSGYMILPDKINNSSINMQAVLTTSKTCFIEFWSNAMDGKPDANTQFGEFTVMTAITEVNDSQPEEETKMIVLTAPQMFLHDEILDSNVYKNEALLLKSVSWLGGNENNFCISGKSLSGSPLMIETMKQAYFIIILVSVVIPLMIFITGIVVFVRRNNL